MESTIDRFFEARAFAVIGVSANRRKFGNNIYRVMREREMTVFPVHPTLSTVEGDACFPGVAQLPGEVEAVVTAVPPSQTERVVRECAARKIKTIWMQPGSESPAALQFARDAGIAVVHGECVHMYLEPVGGVHRVHRFVKKVTGSYTRRTPAA